MLRTLLINGACGDFFSQRFALTARKHAILDVLVLTLALCAPVGRGHDGYFQIAAVNCIGSGFVCALAHKVTLVLTAIASTLKARQIRGKMDRPSVSDCALLLANSSRPRVHEKFPQFAKPQYNACHQCARDPLIECHRNSSERDIEEGQVHDRDLQQQ